MDWTPFLTLCADTVLSGIAGSLLQVWIARKRDKAQNKNEDTANTISFARELRERVESLEDGMAKKDGQLSQLQAENHSLQTQYEVVLEQNARLQLELRALRAAYQDMIVRQEAMIAILRKDGSPIPQAILDPTYVLARDPETGATPKDKAP